MKRFTLRDMLWVALIAALAMGWWFDHHTWKAETRYLVREVPNSGSIDSSFKTCLVITDLQTGRSVQIPPLAPTQRRN